MVRDLVTRGQLQFAGGGWSMNDEAAAHYAGIIDNMSLGLRLLNDTFGQCGVPTVAWQIDPFGHSREQANMFAQMGFDALFFSRLDYRDKAKRMAEQSMEMNWVASEDGSTLFTGVLYNAYGPPPGFCWDLPCDDEPLVDLAEAADYNIEARAAEFLEFVRRQSASYRTNHLLVTMGEDFQYQAAHSWFLNLDRLIRHINTNQHLYNLNIFYSTPGQKQY